MSSGYCNGSLIIFHDLSQQICSGHGWNTFFYGAGKLRVVRVNGSGINHQINAFYNIRSPLTIKNLSAFGCKVIGEGAFFGIRAGNRETFLKKNFSQTAHTDTADTDKVNVDWFIKINGIHKNLLLNIVLLSQLYYIPKRTK